MRTSAFSRDDFDKGKLIFCELSLYSLNNGSRDLLKMDMSRSSRATASVIMGRGGRRGGGIRAMPPPNVLKGDNMSLPPPPKTLRWPFKTRRVFGPEGPKKAVVAVKNAAMF